MFCAVFESFPSQLLSFLCVFPQIPSPVLVCLVPLCHASALRTTLNTLLLIVNDFDSFCRECTKVANGATVTESRMYLLEERQCINLSISKSVNSSLSIYPICFLLYLSAHAPYVSMVYTCEAVCVHSTSSSCSLARLSQLLKSDNGHKR